MGDWKDTLKQVQLAKTGEYKKKGTKLVKPSSTKHLRYLLKGYLKIHPRDLLVKLSPHFNTVIYSNSGTWPENHVTPASIQFVLDNIGDLTKVLLIKDDHVLLRTNRGFFKFLNRY